MAVDPKEVHWPGSGSILEGIPDGWHSISKAATLIGRSSDTLRRWIKDDVFVPSGYQVRGQLTIWLYSDSDIEEAMRIARDMKAGRPPKQPEEVTDAAGS